MTIYIVLRKDKDGKECSVASFTDYKLASKFAQIQKNISGEVHRVIKSLLLDCM